MRTISNGNFFANRNGFTPKYVIIHGTAGGVSAAGIATYFQSIQASSHYVIGVDGEIVQCVDEANGAWGNGAITAGHDPWWSTDINPNNITISIEHCKPSTDNHDQLSPAQKAASFQLIKDICGRHGIPMRAADENGGITGHYSMDPVNRQNCPGPYPWIELFAFLKGVPTAPKEPDIMLHATDQFAREHFTCTPTRWHCTTAGFGFDIALGILAFYQSIGGIVRLPISKEYQIVPGVVAQTFEAGIIVYDPDRKMDAHAPGGDCYLAHINSGPGLDIIAKLK